MRQYFNMIPLLFIALSLSLDAFAVSVGAGIGIPGLQRRYALRASFTFGFFQFAMPLAGWYLFHFMEKLGSAFAVYIGAFDHWIAFGLLAFIGGKMLLEAARSRNHNKATAGNVAVNEASVNAGTVKDTAAEKSCDIRNIKTLLVLALATSIDALAAGITLSIMGIDVWFSAAIIGGITFVMCLCGFEFGRRIGPLLEKWAQIAGGLVLIGIGVKILFEHLLGAG